MPGKNIPRHVGIIMDGNGRWAEARGLTRTEGHRVGFENSKEWLHFVFEQGVEVLTVFAFSTENWKRPEAEVDFLLNLFREAAKEYLPKLAEENICLRFIGDRARLPEDLGNMMDVLEMESIGNTKGVFVPAINYGGRDEILRAVNRFVASSRQRNLPFVPMTQEDMPSLLDTWGLPDVDLIIRTSGEQRISGFLTWQAAYAELYFSDKYWPDFTKEDFLEALEWYKGRKRRFGAISDI